MRWTGRAVWLAVLIVLAGCQKPPVQGNPHYVLGDAWEAEGVWHYPAQSYELNETGLAIVYDAAHAPLTTDGEAFDPTALTGAHQTLQLPAIIRLTNLETGLQTLVRINDRGPPSPARIVAVTPRVATLLAFPPDGVARVRLEVLQAESRNAADTIQGGGAARLDVALAPRASVRQEMLAPPPGVRAVGQSATGNGGTAADPPAAAPSMAVQRLPEAVTRVVPAPGTLWVRLGSFSRNEFARMQLARLGGRGAQIDRVRNGRTVDYRVIMGPYSRVSDADAALAQVIAAGITDGRIVIE